VSNLEHSPVETPCGGALAVQEPVADLLSGRDVPLGRHTTVQRVLPHRERRTVGAWCFLDQFGPDLLGDGPGMRVPPHPHTGLQTVSWLLAGEILHRDSLGSEQLIQPGQLNLMTSGHGIAHSEESPVQRPDTLHGLQLWIALPEDARHGPAAFDHHAALPVVHDGGLTVTVVIGEHAGARSPARAYTPLVGLDISVRESRTAPLALSPVFEYAVVCSAGSADVAGVRLDPGSLLYLGRGRTDLRVDAAPGTRLFLVGGEPFEEELVMWWNFVGRSHEDIVEARSQWEAEAARFGVVRGYDGERLGAPPLPNARLKSRDRHGRSVG
jgi:redox-sensitive bicupin YhaK (pirin superfamily)